MLATAHPKLLGVTIHDSQPTRRTAIAAIFALGYALSIGYCISTAGEPYQAALIEQAKLDNKTNSSNTSTLAIEPGSPLEHAAEPAPDIPTPATPSPSPPVDGGFGDEDNDWPEDWDSDEFVAADGSAKPSGSGAAVLKPVESNGTNSTNGTNGTNSTGPKPRPLPHEWLPSALACALLFLHCTLHALFYLMCHWSVDFKTRMLFAPAKVRFGCVGANRLWRHRATRQGL